MAKSRITPARLRTGILNAQAEFDHLNSQPGLDDCANYEEWKRIRTEAQAQSVAILVSIGFSLMPSSSDAWVRFGGVRSTSTTGLHGALGNWLRAARARLETMEAGDA